MADRKLSDLTLASTLTAATRLLVSVGATSFAVTVSRLLGGPGAVVVEAESDLPAPVGGVITLVADTLYLFRGTVVLTAGNRIEVSEGTSIAGRYTGVDSITGDYAGPLVAYDNATTKTFRTDGITIENTNSDAAARAVSFQGSGAVWVSDRASFTGGVDVLDCGTVIVESATISAADGKAGFLFDGTMNTVRFTSYALVCSGADTDGIRFGSSAVIGRKFSTDNCTVIFDDASQRGFSADAAAMVQDGLIQRASSVGPGSLFEGFDETTPEWRISDSPGIADSATGGGSTLDTTITVPIGAAGTYVDMAEVGANAWSLSSGSSRVEVADAENGELEFTGTAPTRCMVFGGISATRDGGGTPQFEIALFYKPSGGSYSEVSGSARQRDLSARSGAMDTFPSVVTLNTGDCIKMQIRNNDSTNDAVISGAALKFMKLAAV